MTAATSSVFAGRTIAVARLGSGRSQEAGEILLNWARALSQGMLPNRYAGAGSVPQYNSVDAALWFQWPERPAADFVLGARAPLPLRVARIRKRDGINEAAAINRVKRQKPIESSLDQADAVLDTADAPETVRRRLLATLDEHLGLDLVATDPA